MMTGGAASGIPGPGLFAVPYPLVVSAGVAELPMDALLGDPPLVEDYGFRTGPGGQPAGSIQVSRPGSSRSASLGPQVPRS